MAPSSRYDERQLQRQAIMHWQAIQNSPHRAQHDTTRTLNRIQGIYIDDASRSRSSTGRGESILQSPVNRRVEANESRHNRQRTTYRREDRGEPRVQPPRSLQIREEMIETREQPPQSNTRRKRDSVSVPPARAAMSEPERIPENNSSRRMSVSIPINPNASSTTFAHHRVLQNRVRETWLQPGGKYAMNEYTPTFVHDIMMLPGSLSNILEKGSPERFIPRMTPALLRNHQARTSQTFLPHIFESPSSHVQGIVVFGLGRSDRHLIHKHYRSQAKRKKIQIEIEVLVALELESPAAPAHPHRCRVERRTIDAHVWLWNGGDPEQQWLPGAWTLENYLGGNLGRRQTGLRISRTGKGDEREDGYIGRDVRETELLPERRGIVYSGAGQLEWERGNTFTGW